MNAVHRQQIQSAIEQLEGEFATWNQSCTTLKRLLQNYGDSGPPRLSYECTTGIQSLEQGINMFEDAKKSYDDVRVALKHTRKKYASSARAATGGAAPGTTPSRGEYTMTKQHMLSVFDAFHAGDEFGEEADACHTDGMAVYAAGVIVAYHVAGSVFVAERPTLPVAAHPVLDLFERTFVLEKKSSLNLH